MQGTTTVAVMLCLAVGISGWASELVKLEAADPADISRSAEPVTNGVPFPEGQVKDASRLGLVDAANNPVPAVFKAIAWWPEDKSVRWALLDTQCTVPAKGSASYRVVAGTPAPPKRPIEVADGPDLITIDTGRIRFTVRKRGFRLFDAVWLNESAAGRYIDSDRLLDASPEGLAMTVKGVRYTSAGDTKGSVTVEEHNPMRVTLLATGRLAGGPDAYDYQVRISAYAGSSLVKVVPAIVKTFGRQRDGGITFDDLSLVLKLAAAEDLRFALGGEKGPACGGLGADEQAAILVRDPRKYGFSGVAQGEGSCLATKPLTVGWGDLSGPRGGVAVGVYRFWQTFPKAIELSGDGTIDIGLMPKAAGMPQEFFTGMARTHYVLLDFHGKAVTVDELQARFAAFQQPLFVQAPAAWYCQQTKAFGPLAAAGTPLPGGVGEAVEQIDSKSVGSQNMGLVDYFRNQYGTWCDRGTPRCPGAHAYGFLDYGDNVHHLWGDPSDRWNVQWDSHYYDMPLLAVLMWARTGERTLLDYFVDHTWHLQDVAVLHANENPSLSRGGSRRCPAMNHVGHDGGGPEAREPSWNQFDHHKSESLFLRYYLLGDRSSLATAEDLLWLMDNPLEGRDGRAGIRESAHQTLTLVAGSWHTGDRKYLEHARRVIQTNMDRQALTANDGGFNPDDSDGFFADGIVAESLAKYYLASGDEAVGQAVVRWADWQIKHPNSRWASNGAMAQALAYHLTGDDKYLRVLRDIMPRGNTDNIGKEIAESWRNYPYAGGLLLREK